MTLRRETKRKCYQTGVSKIAKIDAKIGSIYVPKIVPPFPLPYHPHLQMCWLIKPPGEKSERFSKRFWIPSLAKCFFCNLFRKCQANNLPFCDNFIQNGVIGYFEQFWGPNPNGNKANPQNPSGRTTNVSRVYLL